MGEEEAPALCSGVTLTAADTTAITPPQCHQVRRMSVGSQMIIVLVNWSGSGVLSQYGIQQPVVIQPGQSQSYYGKRSAVWLPGQGHYKVTLRGSDIVKLRVASRNDSDIG